MSVTFVLPQRDEDDVSKGLRQLTAALIRALPDADARFAQQVATAVDAALKSNAPDGFRRTEGQRLAQLATDLRGSGGRYT